MYDKSLDQILAEKNYAWPFNYKSSNQKSNKVFYLIGDSWMNNYYVPRVFLNQYKDYTLINASVGGMSNSLMIETLQKDMDILQQQKDLTVCVCFSEVGRSLQDLAMKNPKGFNSTHDYFKAILNEQYQQTQSILADTKNFITTAFISNSFNHNKSILDYCGQSNLPKPPDVYTVYANGVYEYMKDAGVFEFDFESDIAKSIDLKNYILGTPNVDDTLHPKAHAPFEGFFENVFKGLQNN